MKKEVAVKILLFVVYHLLVYGLTFYVISSYILPLFTNWWSWSSYIGDSIQFVILIIFILFTLLSMWSCLFNDKLKETDIAQWTFNGWMPYWGKNQAVCKGGFLFTGLPSYIIDLKKFDGTKKTEDKTITVQVEIDGDPNGTKFQVEIQIRFVWCIINTFLYIKNPSKITDIHNIIIKKITEWLNDTSNNYKNVKDLKGDIPRIQDHITATLGSDVDIYGIDISCFNIIDIELPKKVIDQQNDNAARMRKQLADDAMESHDTDALLGQANKLIKRSKKTNPNNPLTLEQALGIIQVQRGNIRAQQVDLTGGGQSRQRGRGNRRGSSPTVFIDPDHQY